MSRAIVRDYYNWLAQLVSSWCEDYGSYQKLIDYLYARDFYSVLEKDENRAADGIDFRARFIDECSNYTYRDMYIYLNRPCSVLEMMVALADRCETSIMYDPEEGDRTGFWFYSMLKNLHLDAMTDDRFDEELVEKIVNNLLERKYKRNGDGGLFVITNRNEDIRKVEIWFQMCWYLDEISEY